MASETRKAIVPIMVELNCNCGGRMHSTGESRETPRTGLMYRHVCEKCNESIGVQEIYPHVEYQSVGEAMLDPVELSEPVAPIDPPKARPKYNH